MALALRQKTPTAAVIVNLSRYSFVVTPVSILSSKKSWRDMRGTVDDFACLASMYSNVRNRPGSKG